MIQQQTDYSNVGTSFTAEQNKTGWEENNLGENSVFLYSAKSQEQSPQCTLNWK